MKKLLNAAALTVLLTNGCASLRSPNHPSGLPLRYEDGQYGLTFFLPTSWRGYSVLIQQWEADRHLPGRETLVARERGPIIVLRPPLSSAGQRYQEIPILVFTRSQWEADKQGKFSIGAGGLEYEIAHNDEYVFGIHSRFNANDSVMESEEAGLIVRKNQTAHKSHQYAE